MNRLEQVSFRKLRRKERVRAKVTGTANRPRMSVFVSSRHVSVQLIDDSTGNTLAAASTVGNKSATGTMKDKAALIGAEIAAKAKTAKIKHVAFDRNGKLYHGRVHELAEAARKGGLEF